VGQIAPGDAGDIAKLAKLGGSLEKASLRSAVTDFYFTNPIARASAIMAECSALAQAAAKKPSMTAAE
jgi:NADH-quinone oxidoreductase subunit G